MPIPVLVKSSLLLPRKDPHREGSLRETIVHTILETQSSIEIYNGSKKYLNGDV